LQKCRCIAGFCNASLFALLSQARGKKLRMCTLSQPREHSQ
jgi:hypothetical protein